MTYLPDSTVSVTVLGQPISISGNVTPVSGTAALWTSDRTGGSRSADKLIFAFLREDGNTDNISLVTDGSSSIATFSYGTNVDVILERCVIQMQDSGMDPTDFGAISTGLAPTRGCRVVVTDTDGSTLLDFLDGSELTQNKHFSNLAAIDVVIDDGTPSDVLTARWTIGRTGKNLYLKSGQSFSVSVETNINVEYFTWVVHGYVP